MAGESQAPTSRVRPRHGSRSAHGLFLQGVPYRPLHAWQVPAGHRLLGAFAAALDGSGPAVLPLSPDLPDERLRVVLRELQPDMLITPEGDTRVAGTRPHLAGEVCGEDGGVADDTALVIATSGSTGAPKGVELSAPALTRSARATLDRLHAGEDERWLACLPADHVAGAQVLVRSILTGNEPIFMPAGRSFDADTALESGADHIPVVPTMLSRMVDAATELSNFRTILLGGASPSPGLVRRARAAGANVVTTYGMTETCGGCVYDGLPLDGTRVELGGDRRIQLAGPVLFSRYRLLPELTAQALQGGWFGTQDLGEWADGRLRVLGRADDVIITGGHNVVPDEVAGVLAEHPAIADVAVVGRPDPEWGERVVAVIVPADTNAPPSLTEVREFARQHVSAHNAPRDVDIVGSIPLLSSGKPDRAALLRGMSS